MLSRKLPLIEENAEPTRDSPYVRTAGSGQIHFCIYGQPFRKNAKVVSMGGLTITQKKHISPLTPGFPGASGDMEKEGRRKRIASYLPRSTVLITALERKSVPEAFILWFLDSSMQRSCASL